MKKYLLLITIAALAFITIGCEKEDHKYGEIVNIQYSFSGGYGTIEDVATRYITIKSDGNVILTNDYDSTTASFDISKEQFDELAKYVYDRIDLFERKVKEENDVLDGGTSRITIEFDNGETKSVGGYMVSDKSYSEISEKISELKDNEVYKEYNKNIGK